VVQQSVAGAAAQVRSVLLAPQRSAVMVAREVVVLLQVARLPVLAVAVVVLVVQVVPPVVAVAVQVGIQVPLRVQTQVAVVVVHLAQPIPALVDLA
jgi:hypothetical protein